MTRTGDMLQFGIPLVALGLTFVLDGEDAGEDGWRPRALVQGSSHFDGLSLNGSPRHDLAIALARTELVTYGLKYGIDAERPNGGGQSFPSGHTAAAFTGAEFIRKRYGWAWGLPGYLAAAYVGVSRVEARAHHTRDVLAGAAIGILSNHELSQFRFSFGDLTVAPSLALPPVSSTLRLADPLSAAIANQADAAVTPALQFQLRF